MWCCHCNILLGSGLVFQNNVVKAIEPSVAAVAGENIAAHKSVSQSSTAYEGEASRAVDGNRDNAWDNRSVTHTDFQDHSWWKVDLAKEEGVGTVRIYNRGDGVVANRLSNLMLFCWIKMVRKLLVNMLIF